MSNLSRFDTIKSVAERPVPAPCSSSAADIDYFGEDVFNNKAILQYLPHETAQMLLATINEGQPLNPAIADEVAHAMKTWALSRGANHYTHWFQPMTCGTAEKHDAFLEISSKGEALMKLSGKNLIVSEPDASSFPSGGLRCTFEARGYTAWDPTSPAFIKRHSNGATLCIPTVFCSYNGQVLDRKTPLLRSVQALKRAVTRFMACFKLPQEPVRITLGIEQEYFLIDRKFYLERPDLVQTGRTLFGSQPPRHQQLDDHYFGSIKPRIIAFMTDVEKELWRLGIPAKTRHNEAAPAQFELASLFEDQNLAIDHNMLIMEVLRLVAARHGLVCLLHEKPFKGVNGSGKHNNWSVSYGKRNLLEAGSNPHENAIFLTFLASIIRAVDLHSDLLRSTTATIGNEHRLGALEAPPAIISIFLGEQLTDVIQQVEKGAAKSSKHAGSMRIGVDSIPPLPRDATDRNRTSPFAFTGNKFEFRTPGSRQPCSDVNTVLNTIVAESLDRISDSLEKLSPKDFNSGLQKLLQDIIKKHLRIIFNGDSYSKEWVEEAERRGLPNLTDTLNALDPLTAPENIRLFEKYGILSQVELLSRHEVFLEEYTQKIRIEGGVALEIARSQIMPAVLSEFNTAMTALKNVRDLQLRNGQRTIADRVKLLGSGLDELDNACRNLEAALTSASGIQKALAQVRDIVDALEQLVADDLWPLPKYREMLFIY